jgi:hypothetical protein
MASSSAEICRIAWSISALERSLEGNGAFPSEEDDMAQAPESLDLEFAALIELGQAPDIDLLKRLRNCTAELPSSVCEHLGLTPGSTYETLLANYAPRQASVTEWSRAK